MIAARRPDIGGVDVQVAAGRDVVATAATALSGNRRRSSADSGT
jgi:hypothetical protein